jgi:ActR/RegA family two-component response regulator
METLNLLILDDNKVIAGDLSNYLNNRFGSRIKIAAFLDADTGIQNIREQSHVIILDYSLPNKVKVAKSGQKFLNSIKRSNPKTKVTLITSDKDIAGATEEMKIGTSKYIMRLNLLDTVVISPFKTVVIPFSRVITYPIKKVLHYYNIKQYLMMFLVAFASIAFVVLAVFLSVELLGK